MKNFNFVGTNKMRGNSAPPSSNQTLKGSTRRYIEVEQKTTHTHKCISDRHEIARRRYEIAKRFKYSNSKLR